MLQVSKIMHGMKKAEREKQAEANSAPCLEKRFSPSHDTRSGGHPVKLNVGG